MMPSKSESLLQSVPIDWLLSGEPFVRYRTMRDLLGKPEKDQEVEKAKKQIRRHSLVKQILARQNKDGYWGAAQDIFKWWPRKDTTFWLLGVLADFGFTKEDKKIAKACEYVFDTQLPSGGFGWAPPPTPAECFTGILTESLAKLGYGSDPRLSKPYEWLIQRQRHDGGFWCKNTGQPGGPREKEPSCALATLCVLSALVQDADLKKSTTASKSAEFLLKCWENRGKMKYAGHDSQIGTGWEKLQYPFTDYRILKYLDTLSQVESIRTDRRIIKMKHLLLEKRDEEGRFYTESVHKVWSNFDFGQKKLPSRWITLMAYRILKRMMEG
jgi:prenyltransferase beta subunit